MCLARHNTDKSETSPAFTLQGSEQAGPMMHARLKIDDPDFVDWLDWVDYLWVGGSLLTLVISFSGFVYLMFSELH